MDDIVTILYTQNIRGQLQLVPRLATLIQREKKRADGRVLLIDAGTGCGSSSELCQLTEGRAAVILLDAVGYTAINVSGYLSASARQKLQANYLAAALVDATNSYAADGIAYGKLPPDEQIWLHIRLDTSQTISLENRTLSPQTLLNGYQLGIVQLRRKEAEVEIMQFNIVELTKHILPLPTISGTLDFIRDEATYYQKQHEKKK